MAWLAVDKDGAEGIFEIKPMRDQEGYWKIRHLSDGYVFLSKGSIKKLIGRELSWSDEPVEI